MLNAPCLPMLKGILQGLRLTWPTFVGIDIMFKVLALTVLTPLVSMLFRLFLAISGRTILADADIARFLLHPLGWLTLVIVGGAVVGIVALEQAVLMVIGLASAHGRSLRVLDAFRFVAGNSLGVLRITAQMVLRILLLSAPFLAVCGALYVLLLTDRDINFYLSHKPPRFWWACGSIGTLLLIGALLVVRCIANWSIAIQLHLFEDVAAGDCLKVSRERVTGHRRRIATFVALWWLACTVMASAASSVVMEIGKWLIPDVVHSLWRFVVSLGFLVLVLGIVNLIVNLLAVISFAMLQLQIYLRFARTDAGNIPGCAGETSTLGFRWNAGRVFAAMVLLCLLSATMGALVIRSVQVEDNVQITAHRGGAANAPENTLAAIRQAIANGADWVEIDVQESRDGIVVVAHDSDLARVAGVDLKIWDATAEQLRAHDIGSYFDVRFSGERVPTLAEVLEACRGRVGVNIELKFYGHNVALEQKVIELVESFDMADEVVVMSLEAALIHRVKRLRPEWTVGLLTAVTASDLTRAQADFLAVRASLATRSFVQRAHAQGKDVHAWTLNDAAAISSMISRGVDNLITDRPDLARQVLRERAEMSSTDRLLVDLGLRFGIIPERFASQ